MRSNRTFSRKRSKIEDENEDDSRALAGLPRHLAGFFASKKIPTFAKNGTAKNSAEDLVILQ